MTDETHPSLCPSGHSSLMNQKIPRVSRSPPNPNIKFVDFHRPSVHKGRGTGGNDDGGSGEADEGARSLLSLCSV